MGPMTNWLVASLAQLLVQRSVVGHNGRSTTRNTINSIRGLSFGQSRSSTRPIGRGPAGALRDGADAKARIAVYGSGDVIRSLACSLEESGANLASERARALFVAIVSAMRPRGIPFRSRAESFCSSGPLLSHRSTLCHREHRGCGLNRPGSRPAISRAADALSCTPNQFSVGPSGSM